MWKWIRWGGGGRGEYWPPVCHRANSSVIYNMFTILASFVILLCCASYLIPIDCVILFDRLMSLKVLFMQRVHALYTFFPAISKQFKLIIPRVPEWWRTEFTSLLKIKTNVHHFRDFFRIHAALGQDAWFNFHLLLAVQISRFQINTTIKIRSYVLIFYLKINLYLAAVRWTYIITEMSPVQRGRHCMERKAANSQSITEGLIHIFTEDLHCYNYRRTDQRFCSVLSSQANVVKINLIKLNRHSCRASNLRFTIRFNRRREY